MANKDDVEVVRSFRWTLNSTSGKLAPHFHTKIELDDYNKTLTIYSLEIASPDHYSVSIDRWVERMMEGELAGESLVFQTLLPDGSPIYIKKYSGLQIVGNDVAFDYGNSECPSRKVKVKYDRCDYLKETERNKLLGFKPKKTKSQQ